MLTAAALALGVGDESDTLEIDILYARQYSRNKEKAVAHWILNTKPISHASSIDSPPT